MTNLTDLIGALLAAAPRAEDVFRSTGQELEGRTDPTKLIAFLCVIAALAVALVLLNRTKRDSKVSPRALHHQGKLLKEIQKQMHLKPAELRQLKALAESQDVENPMTLLLCPSLLAKAVKERPEKVDRRVLASMLKRTS
jgi:hypothetical protein